MKLTKKTFLMIILSIIILPLFGNETLNAYLHIETLVTILNYLIPELLCIFLLFDMYKQKYIPKIDLSLFTTLAFWIILIISFIFSISHEIFNFSNLFKFGCMTFILLILKDIEFEEKQKKTLCYSIVGISLFISIIGILQYVFQISLNTSGIEKYIGALGRINSTTYIATLLDKFLSLNIFFLLFLLYKKYTNKYITIIAFLINVLALVFTFSRTGLLIYLFVIALFILIFAFKKQFINLLIIILTTIAMYFIPGENFVFSSLARYLSNVATTISEKVNLSFVEKTANLMLSPFIIDINEYLGKNDDSTDQTGTNPNQSDDKDANKDLEEDIALDEDIEEEIDIQLIQNIDYSLSSRSYYKTIAKDIMKEHWQFGIGIGSYTHIYNNQNVNDYLENSNYTSFFRYPHNMYYQLGAEVGIIGLILFFVNMIYLLLKRSINSKTIFPMILCICILLVCYTESLFYMKDVAYFTIILIALFSNLSFLDFEKVEKEEK